MLRSELGGHGPAHGVAGDVPVLDIRELGHHILCRIHVEDGQVEGHLHQNAGEAGLPELVQQGQIGGGLHLGPGVEDDRGVRGIGRGEDGQIIPNLQMISACQYLQSHVLRPVVVGHIPEKAARQQNQDRQQNTDGYLPLFAAGFCLCRHCTPSSHCRITAATVSAAIWEPNSLGWTPSAA